MRDHVGFAAPKIHGKCAWLKPLRVLCMAAGLGLSVFTAFGQALPAIPSVPRDCRAAWTATVSNIDWPSRTGLSAAAQQTELKNHMDALVRLNMNTMYLQVRPACDAFYSSTIEPWSQWLSGTQGNSPGYDPLGFAITEAHRRGLELHVWLNPYRASTSTGTSGKAANHITRTRPDLVRTYGSMLYLDPGEPDAVTYNKSVITDIVTRYDIDGVVFDDYFYPYPSGTTAFPDSTSYAKYTAAGGTLALGDWRRDNVNRFVRDVAQIVHTVRPKCQFGIGPFGIWRPGNPSGITGLDAYNDIYADSRLWLQQGWVDSLSPQLYWTLSSTGQPYGKLIDWWVQQNTAGRLVFASNYTSKAGSTSSWPASEIVNEVKRTTQAGAKGNVHFSMKALTNDQSGVGTALKADPYAKPALRPATPWLDPTIPAAPQVTVGPPTGTPSRRTVSFSQPTGAEVANWWCLHTYQGGAWQLAILPAATSSQAIDPTVVLALAVTAVDRGGNESARTVVDLRTGVDGWTGY